MSPDAIIPPATTEQLRWVLKCVKQQQMRQLAVWTEYGWQHRQWFLDELMRSVPGLSSCGLLDTRAPAHAQAGFCHGERSDSGPPQRKQALALQWFLKETSRPMRVLWRLLFWEHVPAICIMPGRAP
jgi:hypothetical protein